MNSNGLKPAQVGPRPGKRARARLRCLLCIEVPRFLNKQQRTMGTISLSHWCLHKGPRSLIPLQRQVPDGGRQWACFPVNLYREICSIIRALTWLTLNSTYNDLNPPINYKVLAQHLPVHGDGAHRGQSKAFPVIWWGLAQLVGPISIYSTQECQNEGQEGMNGPGVGGSWHCVHGGAENGFGGISKLELSGGKSETRAGALDAWLPSGAHWGGNL
jgi:hypothetical protein